MHRRGRVAATWLLCTGMALYSVTHETLRLNLNTLQITHSPAFASTTRVEEETYGDISYSTFLKIKGRSFVANETNRVNSSMGDSDNPVLSFFPEFCEDCDWGKKGVSCGQRADHLISQYNSENAREIVMKDRATCRNPPMNIISYDWSDDADNNEESTMFAHERPARGSISASPLVDVSIYFYDSLRADVGSALETRMLRQYSHLNSTGANLKADVAIIDLFRTFPGRVDDPDLAELFVVPYAHASHCLSKPTGVWLRECRHITQEHLQSGVMDRLSHFEGREKRHLFLNVINMGNSNVHIRNQPLTLAIGPRYKQGDLVVPYLNDAPDNQPGAILNRGREWWTRPRTYSVAMFVGIANSRMKGKFFIEQVQMKGSPRVVRKLFIEQVQTEWGPTLGGLPYAIRVMAKDKKPPSSFFAHMYRDSVFCPTLSGDTPPQKRFFDVILMGCLPVVTRCSTDPSGSVAGNWSSVSWHTDGGRPVEDTYPWIPGSFTVPPEHEINYRSFVVEVPCAVKMIRPTLERLLGNYTEIRRRQLNMMKYAPLLSYGMGSDSHKYPDAFSQILRSLRYYLDGLDEKQ